MPEPYLTESTFNGFMLAVMTLESMGHKIDRQALTRQVDEVAAGNLSLLDSPSEVRAKLEREVGDKSTPEEQERVGHLLANRQELDLIYRGTAISILPRLPKFRPE